MQKLDWTVDHNGRSNSSAEFINTCSHVERLIRGSAHDLINGRADSVARLIVAQMAHELGFAPAVSNGHQGGEA